MNCALKALLVFMLPLVARAVEKPILLEQPTYARMNELVKHLNIPFETIERKVDGEIDLNRLEELFFRQVLLHYLQERLPGLLSIILVGLVFERYFEY